MHLFVAQKIKMCVYIFNSPKYYLNFNFQAYTYFIISLILWRNISVLNLFYTDYYIKKIILIVIIKLKAGNKIYVYLINLKIIIFVISWLEILLNDFLNEYWVYVIM